MASKRKKAPDAISQWEQIKNQRTTWLFPAISLLIIVLTLGLVFVPQVNQILEARQEIDSEAERLERLVAKRTFLEGLSEPEIADYVLLADRALPGNKPVYEVIEALGSELKESGVTLKTYELSPGSVGSDSADVSVSEENRPGTLSSLVLSFEASGTREAVTSLLTRINHLAPLTGFPRIGSC
jgi:hypothetical protein